MNWRDLPKIESIGKIPHFGDNYYDGIIEAHNDKYFITYCDEIHLEPYRVNHYYAIYLVCEMDETLTNLLSNLDWSSGGLDRILAAREYAEENAIGYCEEGSWEYE